MQDDIENNKQAANRKLTLKLLGATVAMFGFGFALVPIYDIMCEALGINGKTSSEAVEQPTALTPDKTRTIKVEFIAHPNPSMAWDFKPQVASMEVHPGEVIQTAYLAYNRANHTIVGQAVPSVSPGLGASYFNKVECFCFNKQPLVAQGHAEMPLIFYIERDIPDSIHTLTLSYTLYDITDTVSEPISTAQIQPQPAIKQEGATP
ncbi:cytochrome c oxidase assembly protein [Vibrio panuliri]|uniref:Cytochrome c oxidase assembly protein CtaG n=1 Tax=Vibrio panuliri TaxID=1381081 RepID=A0ABX3F6M8_9VIBR|nr:cytochrome c oxidase assembly protein [Vibrio panuliri]KAB1457709.1 cytochrome c oxidase assembly protein [Vibrio panuliri]OLQ85807.1 cytochrome c oxidase assembly protein [Vibrio panuliri]